VQPHIQPYLDTYVGPYVEKARPYVEQANGRVIRPAAALTRQYYDKYAAPQIDSASAYLQEEWEKVVRPQVHLAQQRAAAVYEANIAPHVQNASSLVGPYYTSAKDHVLGLHQNYIVPALNLSRPYLQHAYNSTHELVFEKGYPLARQLWSDVVIFVDGNLWPSLKGLYIDNVRPQLVLINERIVKYQESRKLKAIVEQSGEAVVESEPTTDVVSSPPEPDETSAPSTAATDEASTSTKSPEPEKPKVATDESVAEDLRKWQQKFAIAADKGSDDLRDRVTDIVASLVKSDIDGVGRRLATALERSAENELDKVKSKIKDVVRALPEEASAKKLKAAEEEVVKSVRASGLEIRDRAKKVRDWAQNFERDITQRTTTASASTLEVLDGIRDLGLQEIGMRWAWMEGVTYKHWAKYHGLKQRFDDWRSEVQDVATNHPRVEEARSLAQQILEESMAATEDVAKELIRLKEVARWKIHARDATDDFETRDIPVAAVSPASVSAASSVQDEVESVASPASSTAVEALSSSSAVDGTGSGSVESISSLASGAGDVSVASSITSPSPEEIIDAVSASISDVAEDARDPASSSAGGFTRSPSESTLAETTSGGVESSSVDSLKSKASSKIFAGAMAQEVKGQIPVLDDYVDESEGSTFSEQLQSVVNEAGDRYPEVTNAVSEAIRGTTQGPDESITSVASQQYSSALSAASSVLFSTPEGTAEADPAIHQASSLYAEAISRAEEIYTNAKSIASEQISGTLRPIHEQIFSSIESAYAGSKAAASARLDSALKAVSAQDHSLSAASNPIPTPDPPASISSLASSRLQDALSTASAQYSSARTAVGAIPTSSHQQYLQEAQRRYYEAIGIAHEQYSEFVSAATASSVLSSASSVVDDGEKEASTQSLLEEASTSSSVTLDASSSPSARSEQYSAVPSHVPEVVTGEDPDVAESVVSSSSSANDSYAGDPASSASNEANDAHLSSSSVTSTDFSPAPEISVFDSVTEPLNDAVAATNAPLSGTSEEVSGQEISAVADSYSSASSVASEAFDGTEPGHAETTASSTTDAVGAQDPIPTASSSPSSVESFPEVENYSSGDSLARDNLASDSAEAVITEEASTVGTVKANVSEATHEPESGASESEQSSVTEAVGSAGSTIAATASNVEESGSSVIDAVSSGVEDVPSAVSSFLSSAPSHVRDEL